MTVGEKMVQYREERKITLKLMGRRIGVPPSVLAIAEGGGVTHPNFVKRIRKGYELTDEEAEILLPECRRPSSPKYDPDHYVYEPKKLSIEALPKRDEIDYYLAENYKYEKPGNGMKMSNGRVL